MHRALARLDRLACVVGRAAVGTTILIAGLALAPARARAAVPAAAQTNAPSTPAVATSAQKPADAPPGTESPELLNEVRLDVRTAPESLTVGDPLTIEVTVQAPHGFDVRFPDKLETGEHADLLQQTFVGPGEPAAPAGKGETQATPPPAGQDRWIGRYKLALFAVGDVVLPPLDVQVRSDAKYALAHVDSIRVTVATVLTDSLAAAKIRDLKPQMTLPLSPWPWIVAGVALLVALLALAWWLRWRRRPKAEIVPLVRQRPADEVALEALRRLDTRRLPAEGKFMEYYVALSDILRRYLEDGFGVAALEETTEEILYDLDRHGFDRETIRRVRDLCEASDLVKFAKFEPTVEAAVKELDRVREFVQTTAMRMTPFSTPTLVASGPGGAPAASAGGAA